MLNLTEFFARRLCQIGPYETPGLIPNRFGPCAATISAGIGEEKPSGSVSDRKENPFETRNAVCFLLVKGSRGIWSPVPGQLERKEFWDSSRFSSGLPSFCPFTSFGVVRCKPWTFSRQCIFHRRNRSIQKAKLLKRKTRDRGASLRVHGRSACSRRRNWIGFVTNTPD